MVLASFLEEKGFHIIYSGLRRNPEAIVEQALRERVDLIGLSILSGAHKTWFPGIMDLLRKRGREDIKVIGGGIIPIEDIPSLEAMGVRKIFHPATPLEDISDFIMSLLTNH